MEFTSSTHYSFRLRSNISMSTKGETHQKGTEKWASLKQIEEKFSIVDCLYTLFIFALFVLTIPCCICIYVVVAGCRIIWLRILEARFPNLEFIRTTSVRTCVDTSRNQGIITLLLQVKGTWHPDQFKAQLKNDIIDRKKDGQLVFPHLTMVLTSKFGRYAWVPKSVEHFNIENHIVSASPLFRGWPVNNNNIQDYVSEIVSKFLPPELPPWQIMVIHCQGHFYLLIRLHHLYLSEDNLGLGDLLMLKPDNEDWSSQLPENLDSTQHLLTGTFKTPQAIPQLYEHFCESLTNFWNEIVSVYDPQENVAITKKPPTLRTFFILFLIINVSVAKELFRSNKSDIFKVFMIESRKRGFTMHFFWKSIVTTIQPNVIIVAAITWSWWFFIKILLHIPVMILHAIRDTPLYIYRLIIILRVGHELLYLGRIVYTGPRVLLEEIFFPQKRANRHHLQKVSLCGRKKVAWSHPVSLDLIKKLRSETNAASCEVILSATASVLQNYFITAGVAVPESVITISRFIPQEGLLKQSSSSAHSGGGLLCLPLPTKYPQDDPLGSLRALQRSLAQARSHQAALYLASVYQFDYGLLPKVLPTLVARILLNLLSRRYAVTLTEVDNTSSATEQQTRRLLWGQEVESIMYWRPPQANISLSLTLMSYGDSVRLGVMSDSLLSDHLIAMTTHFCEHINNMAKAVGVNGED